MSLRPELEFVRALLPQRSIDFAATLEGEKTMSDTDKSLVLRLAERREARLHSQGSPWTKRAMVMGIVSVGVMGAGVAVAAWTTTGTGTATATAGAATPVNGTTQTIVSSTASPLFPGQTAPVIVNIHNGNAFSVVVSKVVTVPTAQPSTVTSPKNVSCVPSNSAVSMLAATASPNITIAPSADATVSVANAVAMGTGSDDGCQNAIFTFGTPNASVTAASQ